MSKRLILSAGPGLVNTTGSNVGYLIEAASSLDYNLPYGMVSMSLRDGGLAIGLIGLFFCCQLSVRCEDVVKTTVCQVQNDPATYNHKIIEVTGLVSHGFEDFAFFDPTCQSGSSIWLEYGGTVASGTIYCCGVTANRNRTKELVVEGIQIPLVDDEHFQEFDQLVQLQSDSIVHATVMGRFFAGRKIRYPKGVSWGGYGHMGCCSLLAIQQIVAVDPHDRTDFDYGASADQPELNKVGCGFRILVSRHESQNMIESQRKAELGQAPWAFDDPHRVATETLAQLLKVPENSFQDVEQTRKAQGRYVFQWRPKGNSRSYMIVVSRPYWLSFYSNDPAKVAWVALAAYESSCDKRSTIKRIR
jgi:hypothetical protein